MRFLSQEMEPKRCADKRGDGQRLTLGIPLNKSAINLCCPVCICANRR